MEAPASVSTINSDPRLVIKAWLLSEAHLLLVHQKLQQKNWWQATCNDVSPNSVHKTVKPGLYLRPAFY